MRRSFYMFFFLLVIILSTLHPGLSLPATDKAMVGQEKSRVCQSQSHGFRGPCASDHNCALVCRDEGFSGGDCKGFRRRCFCTKLC